VKKVFITSLALLFISTSSVNACGKEGHQHNNSMTPMFQTVEANEAQLLQKGDKKESCPECGMNLVKFYKSSHASVSNGVQKHYCSIHCLYEDKSINKNDVKEMQVVAVDTLKFIDVAKATYVVGSKVRGTMSMISQYAFEDKEKAKAFQSLNGGELMIFEKAYEVASKDFASKESK